MDREYSNNTSDDVKMFVGTEVEHSPAIGLTTLFVVGIQHPLEIKEKAAEYQCDHIYFGANQSFPRNLRIDDDDDIWTDWERMIIELLTSGRGPSHRYICTLDIDVSCAEGLVETLLCDHDNFIPMISVKLPYLQQLGYNATIKLDDIGFRATNPGVWCHSLHDLKNRYQFTDWSKYTQDIVIK